MGRNKKRKLHEPVIESFGVVLSDFDTKISLWGLICGKKSLCSLRLKLSVKFLNIVYKVHFISYVSISDKSCIIHLVNYRNNKLNNS